MQFTDLLTPTALLAVTLAIVALSTMGQWMRRRARLVQLVDKIPGPKAIPILGSLMPFLGTKREDLFTILNQITWKYYPIMRFWKGTMPEIHLSRAEDIEVILNSTIHIEKSSVYNFVRPWLGDGLLTSTGKIWHTHRKLITPAFHFKILESFLDVFVEKSQVLVEVLEKELNNTNGFDVYPYITLCALDIICETAMGTQINAQRDSHSEYVKAVYAVTEGFLQRTLRPWLYPDFIYLRSSRGKAFIRDVSTLHDFTNKVIQERRRSVKHKELLKSQEDEAIGVKRRLAFLDLLLEASNGGTALSDREIREEVDTFMFAGHDTTSSGICWVLFLLGSHPDVQNKAFEEMQSIFQGSNRPPTAHDLAEMKYLERVIKESLRLYPSAPSIARHIKDDIKVGKYTIPAGVNVAVRIFHVHRDPEHYPNPEKFDPDNFLPERVQGRHPYAYIPFSAGSRNCIGQKFAMWEEKAVLCTLLRKYVVAAVDRAENLKLVSEIILRPSQGVRLRLTRRTTT